MKSAIVIAIIVMFLLLATQETDVKLQIGCVLLAAVNGVLFA